MALPLLTVKINDKWVPMDTLPPEQQQIIKNNVVRVLQATAERQIKLMIQRENDIARAAAN